MSNEEKSLSGYQRVLKEYKKMLSDRMESYSCLTDLIYVEYTVTDSDGTTRTEYILDGDNKAKTLVKTWMSALINEDSYPSYENIPHFVRPTSISIPHVKETEEETTTPTYSLNLYMYYTIMSLFIQLEAKPWDGEYTERSEDVNYNLLNGYADSSKSFEDYNTSTQEFYKRAEYWNVRGHLYELLVKAHEGHFIELRRNLVEILCAFIDAEEISYKQSPLVSDNIYDDDDDDNYYGRPLTKAEKYWNENYTSLLTKFNDTLGELESVVEYFHTTLVTLVYDYLRLYERTSEYLSSGNTFIEALKKTSTEPGKCLAETHTKLGLDGFKLYSSDMSVAYDLFLKAKAKRDASKYASDDDNNIYLRKYYSHEVFTKERFFETAVSMLSQVKDFRSRLDI